VRAVGERLRLELAGRIVDVDLDPATGTPIAATPRARVDGQRVTEVFDETFPERPSLRRRAAPRGVEQRRVADYEATVLTADSSAALIAWLRDHGFAIHHVDEENMEYYVDAGGFYFVALKVDLERAPVSADGMLMGRLQPIELRFEAAEPMLPSRSTDGR
jgi:hypothetical protein